MPPPAAPRLQVSLRHEPSSPWNSGQRQVGTGNDSEQAREQGLSISHPTYSTSERPHTARDPSPSSGHTPIPKEEEET